MDLFTPSTSVDNERAIRAVVASFVKAYASGFSDRHLSEVDDEEGTINMKIHNVFIAALGADTAQKTLGQTSNHGGTDKEGLNAHINQTGHGAGGVIGVKRT